MDHNKYINLEIEIIRFDSEDIITTSGIESSSSNSGIVLPDDEW